MNTNTIEHVYPLAPAQQGLLLRTVADTERAAQIDQSCGALTGPIDARALEKAWQWAVDRHPMLRTAFAWRDVNQPVQAVLPEARVPFQFYDWRGVAEKEQDARLSALLAADRDSGFILSEPPLMRLSLIRTGNEAYRLAWSRHRLLLDGWSVAILMHEIDVAYSALIRGRMPAAETPGTYGDYVGWLSNRDWTKAESFWRAALHGMQHPTPLGRIVPSATGEENGNIQTVTGRLPKATAEALTTFARERRLTLNTLVQGAWAILLSRYSGQQEVVFGTTVAGRPADLAGVDTTVGLFTNSLPLRVSLLSHGTGLGSWLAEVQAQHQELREYEYCSAGQVHSWCEVAGSASLYHSILVFQNYPVHLTRGKAASLDRSRIQAAIGTHTDYPLSIHVLTDAGLGFALVFDTARLVPDDVERMLMHLTAILEQFARKPDDRIDGLGNLIPEGEIPRFHAAPTSRLQKLESFVAPETDIERAIARIWRELLGISEIGLDDNFFAMRGHSLMAMRLISRLRDAFQVEVPLGRLYAAPTIAGLSQTIEEAILAQLEALSEEEARSMVQSADGGTPGSINQMTFSITTAGARYGMRAVRHQREP